ncbi:hypothetical protein [Nocardia altamirensis]|nr:hypothetical protein [Nocardia altamirensis]
MSVAPSRRTEPALIDSLHGALLACLLLTVIGAIGLILSLTTGISQ